MAYVKLVYSGKRLHPNWGEKLSERDILVIIEHFRTAAADHASFPHRCPLEDVTRLSAEMVAHAEGRIRLWESVLAAKRAGQPVMPLLEDARR